MSTTKLPGTLVSVEWLAARLGDPDLRIVDIRGYVKAENLGNGRQRAIYLGARDEFESEHLPGSVFVDWTRDIIDPDDDVPVQIAGPERFAEAMSALGIDHDTDVVVVDHTGGHFATRLWWALKFYGHDRAAVLDGGFGHWRELGLPTTTEIVAPSRRTFLPMERPQLRREAADVAAAIADPAWQIVDAREPAQYTGELRRGDRGGHIPSAINVWAKSLVNADGTWKSDAELAEVLTAAGVATDRSVVAYCNGGVTATAVLFALDRIGHPSWANYDGSWNEWGERTDLPVTEGKAPGQ